MKGKITLYHGSESIIEMPQFGAGNPHNDYGLGFYCTESEELAKEWACSVERDGFVNKYELDMTNLHVLSLTDGNYHILNWLSVLLENRTFRIRETVAAQAKAYILDNFSVDYQTYDVIRGYRADDSYFSFANAFLNNTISLAQLEKAMVLGKLGEQIVPRSKKAFSRLVFGEAKAVEGEIYYPKKMARDMAARETFGKEKQVGIIEGEVYVIDIMRGRWKNDDARLQRVVLR